ncbi:MAG: GerMN domain-containing protein [Lachnospiraceae bacterium]|nr:GerMN domain-containing protein [Lachnospiraceae bacterium]
MTYRADEFLSALADVWRDSVSCIKRLFAVLALTAALMMLGGCANNGSKSTSYTIYYKSSSGTSLYEVSYVPSAETFDEMMTELMTQMATVPEDALYASTIPETVVYQGYERGIDALRIDFSSEYYEMSNTTEVLLRAAVVKTICQIPGVTKIMITVDSRQLVDADGEAVAAMDAESFIDTKNGGINSYQSASLVLYFPNQDGTKLKKEVRNVDYSSNMVLGRVIVEQLIAGSEYSDRRAVLNSSTEIVDVSEKNGICTLNFSEEFNQAPAENAPSAEAALYAIVNSICETSDTINGVKITIEGSSNVLFWDEIDLNNVFIMNQEIIEMETLESGEAEGEPNLEETEEAGNADEAEEDADSGETETGEDLAGSTAEARSAGEDASDTSVSGVSTDAGSTGTDASADAETFVSDASGNAGTSGTDTSADAGATGTDASADVGSTGSDTSADAGSSGSDASAGVDSSVSDSSDESTSSGTDPAGNDSGEAEASAEDASDNNGVLAGVD